MALLAVVLLTSCKDDSGTYVEQLYTNSQKSIAIKSCLKCSADTALNHLCDNNGFYEYQDGKYRIDYAPLQSSLFDTLSRHGFGYLADSLVKSTNRLASSCKSQISPLITAAIDSLEIVNHDMLIDGDLTAITDYFELYKYRVLKSAFQTPVSIRMILYNITPLWNDMVLRYAQYTTVPLNFDIQNYVIEKMLADIFAEMREEETLIRTDPDHRNANTALLAE